MKRFFLIPAICLALTSPAAATVEDGVREWQLGRYREAVMLWLPAAARGNEHALYNLGLAHRQGRGVPRDLARAEDFFRRAADKGHGAARTYLGILLAKRGEEEEALALWRQSAEDGDRHARYMLGVRHYTGRGVERDLPRAYSYILLASNDGLTQAGKVLRRMNAEMSEADREAGRRLATATAGRDLAVVEIGADARPPAERAAEQMREQREQVAASTPPPRPPSSAPPAAQDVPASDGAKFRVQLGAFAKRDQAETGWAGIQSRNSALFANVEPVFTPFEGGIRLRVGAYEERAAASSFCEQIKAAGQACFVTAVN